MSRSDKMTRRQFLILVILFSIGSSILFIPSAAARDVKQGAWIPIVAGIGTGLLIVLLLMRVAHRYPDLTYVEINRRLLGKWMGTIVSVVSFVACYVLGASTLVYYMGDFMTTQVMRTTPEYMIHIMFTLIVVMGLLLGLKTLAFTAEVLFPIVVVLFAALIVFVSPKIQLEHFQPVFEAGILPILKGVFSYMSYTSFPLVFFLMIYPSAVQGGMKASGAFLLGSFIGGMFLLIVTAACVGVLGAEQTARQFYPSYALAKRINIANFITRIEVIVAAFWIIALYFKTVIYFYASVKGMAQLLKLDDERVLVIPLGLLMVPLSLFTYPSSAYQLQWDEKVWPVYSITIGLLFPLLLVAAGAFRKKIKP
ncbi:GerAB/ArcD/ProY family transporter [Paenibacillus elgii]|uniref:GerAB/ArcD/ProY family transporter n=1 Tax=Paenibacillus elgii TaxID=189691 RepID=UPI0013D4DA9D|nr:endospore germination permease [Paenibacillus elgii]